MTSFMVRPRLGISSCLIGEKVRYDGGHKHDSYLTQTLARYFELVPFCPERSIGLPTPRNPIRLVSAPGSSAIHAVEVHDASLDYTEKPDRYARQVSAELSEFCGYIVKRDSPSCGMEGVSVHEGETVPPVRRGVGVFTARLMAERPGLPFEDEGRLADPLLRQNFICRIFTMARWQEMKAEGLVKQRLLEFHARHKFLILAHHEATYRELGRILSDLSAADVESIAATYLDLLMQGLRHLVSPGKHANVLMHLMGFVKDRLSPEEKSALLRLIDAHQRGEVPVMTPINLLNQLLQRYPHEYISRQYYLRPAPAELMLSNGD
jgi:uncharacterized protein YbgA (DUF1722 family)/uncharacterized protein YbbK (DUF523 family)